nr:hypothetical protein I308_03994 [Cryptococcus tetragattii IND107]
MWRKRILAVRLDSPWLEYLLDRQLLRLLEVLFTPKWAGTHPSYSASLSVLSILYCVCSSLNEQTYVNGKKSVSVWPLEAFSQKLLMDKSSCLARSKRRLSCI